MEDRSILEHSGNGDNKGYREFLEEAMAKGDIPIMDGEKIARDGAQLVFQSQARRRAMDYVVDEPGVEQIYDKEGDKRRDAEIALLTRLLKRANFVDRAERFAFLDYVDWCIEFEVPLDNAIRCLVSSVSEGRESINDLIAISTNINYNQRTFTYNANKGKKDRKDRIGE